MWKKQVVIGFGKLILRFFFFFKFVSCEQKKKKKKKKRTKSARQNQFSVFFAKWKIDFLTDTVQTKNRDKQFSIPHIEAHPTHSSERKNLTTFEPVSENNENRLFWETSLFG